MALRKGNQRPTFSTVTDWAYSFGDRAEKLFTTYGLKLYESQTYELHVFLARNDDGSFAAKTICISKPRQNGKSYAARLYAIWMAAIEGKHVLYSAHHGKTVRTMFKEIKNFVEQHADFAALLKPNGEGIYKAQGSEGLYFVDEDGNDAGLIEFQTRTNSAARGETYQVIIVDEAQELTAEQLEALKPTTIAADDAEKVDSDPQMIYLCTPPNAKCVGTEFRRWHDEAHSNVKTSIWWMEWAVDEIPDKADRESIMELVYLTNPAMGYRIKESTMYDVLDTMSIEGFARECLGYWEKVTIVGNSLITVKNWEACYTDEPENKGILCYGVKFSTDGMLGVVAACYKPEDGKPLVYVVTTKTMENGLTWFVENLTERAHKAAKIVIDGKSNADNLYAKLHEAGVTKKALKIPTTAEVVTAYSMIVNAVKEHSLLQTGQQALDKSATRTIRRDIGKNGGFGFESTEEAEASLIEACAIALWGAMTTTRKPGRKAKVRC